MNTSKAGVRRPYIRPMNGWWQRNSFFKLYMLRELTAIAVYIYAVILTVGVLRLSQGEAAWNAWLAALRSPWSIALHLALLALMLVHGYSWFEIMPKTLPPIRLGGERVGPAAIQRSGWVAAVVVTLMLLALTWGWLS